MIVLVSGLVAYVLGIPLFFKWRLHSLKDALDTDKVKARYGFLVCVQTTFFHHHSW